VSGAPLIATERLELWVPQPGDLTGLVELMAPESVRVHLGSTPHDAAGQFGRLLRNAGSWSLYGYGTFVVRLRGDPRIVGNCGVFRGWRGFGKGMDDVPEAGWTVAMDLWRRGIAAEAMEAALGWFDAAHGPRRIACMIEDGNAPSHRLARKLGFSVYDHHALDGGATGVVLYERLPA
jgi:RimJ/RimL family protein N-acetyltransferase